MTLADIDGIFESTPGLHLAGELKVDQSGVDPLGLRQLNLDLMDATVPGINNVTKHVRPYAFMAWTWWKSWQLADVDGYCDTLELADRALRYETMYAWAHELEGRPLIGATALRQHLPRRGDDYPFCFEGERWEALKKEMTSIMAPTQYGPSIKATRWLLPAESGAFRLTEEGQSAVRAIEDIVSQHLPKHLFVREAPKVTWSDVLPFAEQLRVDQATEAERDAFRFLFRDGADRSEAPRELRRRRATLDLVRAHLLQAGRALSLGEIRRILAKGACPPGCTDDDPETVISISLLSVLQARQLQRLATEAMLLWTETNLSRESTKAVTSETLASRADKAARGADALAASVSKVGDYFDLVERLGDPIGWPAAAAEEGTDVVDLMDRLIKAQREERERLPELCLKSFAVVYAISRALRSRSIPKDAGAPLDGRPDRLPFGILEKHVDELRDRPLMDLWRRVIESWVIGQHVHWSAVRGGDGKKRLRIALDDHGWIRVRTKSSAPFVPTGDRLLTMLSLGTECGLFKQGASPQSFCV